MGITILFRRFPAADGKGGQCRQAAGTAQAQRQGQGSVRRAADAHIQQDDKAVGDDGVQAQGGGPVLHNDHFVFQGAGQRTEQGGEQRDQDDERNGQDA